jgi:hypothetical protein
MNHSFVLGLFCCCCCCNTATRTSPKIKTVFYTLGFQLDKHSRYPTRGYPASVKTSFVQSDCQLPTCLFTRTNMCECIESVRNRRFIISSGSKSSRSRRNLKATSWALHWCTSTFCSNPRRTRVVARRHNADSFPTPV